MYLQVFKEVIDLKKRLIEDRQRLALAEKTMRDKQRQVDTEVNKRISQSKLFNILSKGIEKDSETHSQLEKTYITWFLSHDESWDFRDYDPELEKILNPIQSGLKENIKKMESLQDQMCAQLRKQVAQELKEQVIIQNYEEIKKITDNAQKRYNGAYDIMLTTIQNNPSLKILKEKIDFINKMFNQTFEEKQCAYLTPIINEKGLSLKLEFSHDDDFTDNIDPESFDEEGEEIKDSLEQKLETMFEQFDNTLYHAFNKCYEIHYNIHDIEIVSGDTFYSHGSYDSDNGYGDPCGDFRCGETTAAGNIEIVIII